MASWILPRSCSWILLNSSVEWNGDNAGYGMEYSTYQYSKDHHQLILEHQLLIATLHHPNTHTHTHTILAPYIHSLFQTLTAATVRPALVLPIPVVRTERGINFTAYFNICDFPVPNYE